MARHSLRAVAAFGLVALVLASPAHAQSTGWLDPGRASYSGGDRQASYYEASRAAYDQGYREGLKRGDHDGKRAETFRYEDEKTYQRGDKGYRREYGSLDRYRESFRHGYSAGYSAGYERVAPLPAVAESVSAIPRH